jgi:hypothetical protein
MKERTVTPNVVPQTFSPKPEDFAPQISAELRSQQAHWARGFTLQQIEKRERQLQKAWYKREEAWQFSGEVESDEKLRQAIKEAKTAQTKMLDKISEWAGAYEEDHFKGILLPKVWSSFLEIVRHGEPAPQKIADDTARNPDGTPYEGEPGLAEEALAPEDLEPETAGPVLPSARYDDLASQPKSEVVPPKEETLGDILSKIEKEKSED